MLTKETPTETATIEAATVTDVTTKDASNGKSSKKKSSPRHDRTSMDGMIYNANRVLNKISKPNAPGIPKKLFRKCKGICLLSVLEAGFVFSGNVGTGILLKRKDDGSWSLPCAIGLGGVGWGWMAGGQVKEVIIFIFDDMSLEGMIGDTGLRLGGQANVTVGNFGRNYDTAIGISNKGMAGTVTVAMSKGLFGGLSVEGAMIGVRPGANDSFYGTMSTPHSIIDGSVELPATKVESLSSLYETLAVLSGPASTANAAASTTTTTATQEVVENTDADFEEEVALAIAASERLAGQTDQTSQSEGPTEDFVQIENKPAEEPTEKEDLHKDGSSAATE